MAPWQKTTMILQQKMSVALTVSSATGDPYHPPFTIAHEPPPPQHQLVPSANNHPDIINHNSHTVTP